jgi:transposase
VLAGGPAHVKAVKGRKTGAKDCARLAGLLECGLLRGSCIPPPELKEVRDLTRLRTKKVQARTSDVQRLGKTLESAGIKVGSVASGITGKGPAAMIEALIDGERRGAVMADLAIGRARAKMADLAMALEGRFTDHHAMMRRLHLDAIALHDAGIADLDARIAARAAPWRRETDLLKTIPGFGDTVAWTWIAEIGPAPHEWFASGARLASWAGPAPGNYVSAGKRGYGRTSEAGTYIKPVLVQAAWSAVRTPGRLQARYNRLVRRMGGQKNPAAKKKAIVAIAHTLLKIACSVPRTGTPCQDPGAGFYTRRQQPAHRQAWLERQLRSLYPGCAVTVTIDPPAGTPPAPGHVPEAVLPQTRLQPTAPPPATAVRPAGPRFRVSR